MKRGFTLPELLTVAFLTAILWLLVDTLLFPIFRSIARNSNRSVLYRNFHQFLRTLENDFRTAAPAGLQFSPGDDWTLGLVLRIPPANSSTAWSKDLLIYHYDPAQRKISRSLLSPGPMLDGGPPPLFEVGPLLSTATLQNTLTFVTEASWPNLQSPCEIRLQPPEGGDALQAAVHCESYLCTP